MTSSGENFTLVEKGRTEARRYDYPYLVGTGPGLRHDVRRSLSRSGSTDSVDTGVLSYVSGPGARPPGRSGSVCDDKSGHRGDPLIFVRESLSVSRRKLLVVDNQLPGDSRHMLKLKNNFFFSSKREDPQRVTLIVDVPEGWVGGGKLH